MTEKDLTNICAAATISNILRFLDQILNLPKAQSVEKCAREVQEGIDEWRIERLLLEGPQDCFNLMNGDWMGTFSGNLDPEYPTNDPNWYKPWSQEETDHRLNFWDDKRPDVWEANPNLPPY